MKDFFLTYARYSQRANASALSLTGGLPLSVRNKAGRGYYGSLHQMVAHILDANLYFMGLFRPALDRQRAVFEAVVGCATPKEDLDAEGFARLKESFTIVDEAVVALVRTLEPADLTVPVKLDWYKDRDTVPFHFLFNQLIVHGIHHRGQVSQILDELKVEHDFSGIDLAFMGA